MPLLLLSKRCGMVAYFLFMGLHLICDLLSYTGSCLCAIQGSVHRILSYRDSFTSIYIRLDQKVAFSRCYQQEAQNANATLTLSVRSHVTLCSCCLAISKVFENIPAT